jgi:hypothetical protein
MPTFWLSILLCNIGSTKVGGCCHCARNYHHQCTILTTELEEARDNVYISHVKEGNPSLFCNLVLVVYGDLGLLKPL